jgi:Ran GTPase-activating protein (RanGAP) involved in mRNA processing and transport
MVPNCVVFLIVCLCLHQALCDALGKNSMQLQEIRLSGNNFSAVSVTLLLRAICTATSVVHTLVCNRINLDSLYEYPISLLADIRAARQMRYLQMDDCGLGCSGGLVLLSMLMQLPCVRTLSFQRNNIDDSSGSRSLFWLKPLSSALALERLSLSHNRLHDEAVLFMIKVVLVMSLYHYIVNF